MSESKQCFIMGLPNAGKTTYLAALWYSLNNALEKNKVKLNIMGDASYLSEISKKWVNVDKIDRTKLGYEKSNISIELIDENKNVFKLRFPDLSGETFQNQYAKREISNELVDYIRSSNGILVFINVSDIDSITLISEVSNNTNILNNTVMTNPEEKQIRNPMLDDPLQVQIIELLQFLMIIKKDETFNLGIVLSAWDLVIDLGLEQIPEEFLMGKMNMLWQFIQSNTNNFRTSIWGVSAQGGKLEKEEELLNVEEPMKRILVVNKSGDVSNDITLPIYEIVGEVNDV